MSSAALETVHTDLQLIRHQVVLGSSGINEACGRLEAVSAQLQRVECQSVTSEERQVFKGELEKVRSAARRITGLLEAGIVFRLGPTLAVAETSGSYAPDGSIQPQEHHGRINVEG